MSEESVNQREEERSGATATVERPQVAPPKVDRLPPWNVLLHNDPVNTMDYVIRTLIELVRMNQFRAMKCMLEAHQKGMSLVATTHREHAELLCEQFASKKLKATMERAG
ncbi:MAG TPA: ATP-dependent Clp protease adaptor ClpS [Phycisphaerales bacterium]|nr:ATP-dependent Clp protease adaptor ClpS [Phycisphaerales bacterium]